MVYLVLLIAVLSRVLPVLLHTTGGNVTTVGATLLFFGASLGSGKRWHALFAVAVLAATDWWLTVFGYGYSFHLSGYLVTWAWYAAVCLAASAALHRKRSTLRIEIGALASATSFFLLSNFVVFWKSGMYPHSFAGLTACYASAVPFYRNDLLSTMIFTALFFLLPATERVRGLFGASHGGGAAAA